MKSLLLKLPLLFSLLCCASSCQNTPGFVEIPKLVVSTSSSSVETPAQGISTTSSSALGTPYSDDSGAYVSVIGSSTPDLRLPPERWMEWEVIPTSISPKMRDVYKNGLALGNNPHAFSKVGDCQNICDAFLCLYDKKGGYKLNQPYPIRGYPQPSYHPGGSDFAYLQESIDYFAGSWGRESIAVEGGFNFPAVFSPLRADPEFCNPGETPLVCELRLHKPSFVIIGMEYWYKGRTAENYEKYLRKTVEYALEQGIIPILEAKADNLEMDHSINLTTARIAYEYETPFWNFWRAAQKMTDKGMDIRRDHENGFHITFEAQLIRSFTALQTLHALRRSLTQIDLAPTSTVIPQTPSPTLAPTPIIPPNTNWSDCPLQADNAQTHSSKGKLIFGITQNNENGQDSLGVYKVELTEEKSNWQQLFEPGVELLGISKGGCWLLAHKESTLFITTLDGEKRIILSQRYFANSTNAAQWLPERNQIAFIEQIENAAQSQLMLFTLNNSKLTSLSASLPSGLSLNKIPLATVGLRLYPSADEKHLYWEEGNCTPNQKCTVWMTTLDDVGKINHQQLDEVKNPLGAPQGDAYVYTAKNEKGGNSLYWKSISSAEPIQLDLRISYERNKLRYPAYIPAYSWSPDGRFLSVIGAERSEYSGRLLEFRYFIVDLENQKTILLPQSMGNNLLSSIWAPNGDSLFFSGSPDGYHLLLKEVNLTTKKMRNLEDESLVLPTDSDLSISQIFWTP